MTAPAKKRGRGRPPLDPSARATWEKKVRLTAAEGERVEQLAAAAQVEVSTWLRDVVAAKLKRSRA